MSNKEQTYQLSTIPAIEVNDDSKSSSFRNMNHYDYGRDEAVLARFGKKQQLKVGIDPSAHVHSILTAISAILVYFQS